MTKKIGLPDYGSVGFSCSVQAELPEGLIFDDPEAFQQRVRSVYVQCARAVNDELARHQQGDNGQAPIVETHRPAPNSRQGNGTGGHRASQKQLDYIRQLAGQIRGLGVRRLDTLSQRMFGKPAADLTSLDASGMIDMLKSIKSGEVNLDNALNGVTS